MSANINLFAYDSLFDVIACSSFVEGTVDESCTSPSDADGKLWIAAIGSDGDGGTFILNTVAP